MVATATRKSLCRLCELPLPKYNTNVFYCKCCIDTYGDRRFHLVARKHSGTVLCNVCTNEFKRDKHHLQICHKCKASPPDDSHEYTCVICKAPYTSTVSNIDCCPECMENYSRAQRRKRRAKHLAGRAPIAHRKCTACGKYAEFERDLQVSCNTCVTTHTRGKRWSMKRTRLQPWTGKCIICTTPLRENPGKKRQCCSRCASIPTKERAMMLYFVNVGQKAYCQNCRRERPSGPDVFCAECLDNNELEHLISISRTNEQMAEDEVRQYNRLYLARLRHSTSDKNGTPRIEDTTHPSVMDDVLDMSLLMSLFEES